MPNKLLEQLEAVMPAGMQVPQPIKQLYDWIENRNLFVDNEGGRVGFLYPDNLLKASWTDEGRDGGTEIEFAAEGSVNLHYWFGAEHEEVNQRLCVFAQTGSEGSMGAFWLSDSGEVRVVHLGSGSGSTLTCMLAKIASISCVCWPLDIMSYAGAMNSMRHHWLMTSLWFNPM